MMVIKPVLSRNKYIERLVYPRDLLRELVGRDMKLRYKRSVLGIVWSLINPLAQLVVFSFVFGLVLPLNIPNYASFVFAGLLVWTWFQLSLFQATGAIVDNRDLIRRPGFPAAVLPIVTVSTHFVHFVLALPILLVFLWFEGNLLTATVLVLPLLIALQFLFTLSLSYIVAIWHVSFRDTQHLLGIALLLVFYLTPIFYDASFVPDVYRPIYNLNPMVQLVSAYRAVLLHGELPAVKPMLTIGLFTLLLLFTGYRLFIHASYRFVEEL